MVAFSQKVLSGVVANNSTSLEETIFGYSSEMKDFIVALLKGIHDARGLISNLITLKIE